MTGDKRFCFRQRLYQFQFHLLCAQKDKIKDAFGMRKNYRHELMIFQQHTSSYLYNVTQKTKAINNFLQKYGQRFLIKF